MELTFNQSSSLIIASTLDRKLMVFDSACMKKKGEVVVSDHPLHKMAITHDDSTVVVSDQACNLFQIDLTDAANPRIKAKDKVDGIGIPNSLHL